MGGIIRGKYNEQGFTLIETLLSLFILLISLPFIVYLLGNTENKSQIDLLSAEQFFVFVRNDLYISDDVIVKNNQLSFKYSSNQTISLEHYGNVIRRRVNGQGHEIYLRNVKSFVVQDMGGAVLISVTTTEGNRVEQWLDY